MPGLEQGVGEQRKGTRRVLEIVQDEVHQPRAKPPIALLGRSGDGPSQLVGRHRADVFLLARHGAPQVGVRGQVGVEVGAERDDDGDRTAHRDGGHEVRDEGASLLLVAAQREELLELVDDQEDPVAFASPPPAGQPTRDEVERSRLASQVLDQRRRRAQ